MKTLLISACLLGLCCRYDGGSKPQPYCVKRRLIICRHKKAHLFKGACGAFKRQKKQQRL